MSYKPNRLRRELYVIVIIKLLVIAALWWVFVRDAKVEVDGERVASHFVTPTASLTPLRHQGNPHVQ